MNIREQEKKEKNKLSKLWKFKIAAVCNLLSIMRIKQKKNEDDKKRRILVDFLRIQD